MRAAKPGSVKFDGQFMIEVRTLSGWVLMMGFLVCDHKPTRHRLDGWDGAVFLCAVEPQPLEHLD